MADSVERDLEARVDRQDFAEAIAKLSNFKRSTAYAFVRKLEARIVVLEREKDKLATALINAETAADHPGDSL